MPREIAEICADLCRNLCCIYSLPDPLLVLTDPPTKNSWKKSVTVRVTDVWHKRLCEEVQQRHSLVFLRQAFLPLNGHSHPLWSSCLSSPTAVRAATVQARLLTGRYPHDELRSKWDGGDGACRIPGCGLPGAGTVHLLSGQCRVLRPFLSDALGHCLTFLKDYPDLFVVTVTALSGPPFNWVRYVCS